MHKPFPTDLRAPGAIDQLLAAHRAVFGSARMQDDPAAPPQGDQPPASGDPAATPAPTPGPPANAPQEPAWNPAAWDGKVETLPDAAQKMIRDLRTESAERRTKLTAAEQAQQDAIRALAKAAGIELPGDDSAPPKPDELAQQLADSQQHARQAAIELAVFKAAPGHQGDPNALLDSRSFLAKVQALDPTADDFASKVGEAIKSAIADNPKLKAASVASSSSADHAGGSGEGSGKPTTLEEAVAQKMAR